MMKELKQTMTKKIKILDIELTSYVFEIKVK